MRVKVGVFFGGRSVEHEVSVVSALQAIEAMNKEKYEVVPIYIAKSGLWYTGDALLDVDRYKDSPTLLSACRQITVVNNLSEVVVIRYPLGRFSNNVINTLDVALPVLHGTYGEDGAMQGFFESVGLPYAGCDVLSSAIGMDKIVTKSVLLQAGIPIVKYSWFYALDWLKNPEATIAAVERDVPYPVIVKPANVGSSVGIKKAANRAELEEAIELARNFSAKILIEELVVSLKEINCSVLGDWDEARTSVCEEPVSSSEILSYQDKYLNKGTKGMGGAKRKVPADLSEQLADEIKSLAKKTFLAVGCAGVVRIDFMIDAAAGNKVYVNELNTIPGSLSFYLWEATGVKFPELIDELIRLALKRKRDRSSIMYSYDANIFNMKGTGGLKMGSKSKA
ncbi:MAG: D-alanine--D-alanine ligase [Negativicutes bacterium]|nr:D-alanine--D-alanine ligase [Negativicutes bacterium]